MVLVPAVAEREFDRALTHVVRAAAHLDITPNSITTAALLLNFASGILLSMGYFASGGLVILASGMLDMVDGKLARMTGQVSIFGAIYDATVDRVGELALFTGIGAYLILHHLYVTSLIAVAATGGSLLISYVRARAESYDIPCNLGIMCRGARILLLGAGSTQGEGCVLLCT